MRFARYLLAILSAAHLAMADVDIKKPESGQSFDASSGSVEVEIEWEDDTEGFDFSDLDNARNYDIVLMTGTNDDIETVKQLGSNIDNEERSFTAEIDNDLGPNGYYFFQIYTSFPNDGYTIHYTNRFRLTGMSGGTSTFTFNDGLFSHSGDQPSPQWNAGGTALKVETESFSLTYTAQSGWVRYAPMQPNPTFPVTGTNYSHRHETSDYTAYTTISHFPDAWTTTTAERTYSINSRENTAPVNSYPTYWYPPSSRVSSATLSDAKKKRWL
ncbi:hypothetical protein FT663_03101 [Candidozyma haemuli var. vulneris]|nr:hypothetical protein FT662_02899 [[Candida] haemuloni var. vulneris]KAF3990655.1 hypothetical protein FT663_03101 [[Candida] haemuloni var. vulneris]